MSLLGHLSIDDLGPMLQVVQRSLGVRSHGDLFHWLQEDLQRFIPHDVVIAAWGDFSMGLICFDVVSPIDGLRTDRFSDRVIEPFANALFSRWLACGNTPFTINSSSGFDFQPFEDQATVTGLHRMQGGVVHGIKDRRGRHDCIYILLGSTDLADGKARDSLRFMLPYIDAAFRQVPPLPEQYFDIGRPTVVNQRLPSDQDFDTQLPVGGLSGREMEIMEWVRMGKTNHEIGIILDISAFTVKNHMQRIFKKLDVMNRAQAVSKVETLSRLNQPTEPRPTSGLTRLNA
jgi:transcriptional regulator EpsA